MELKELKQRIKDLEHVITVYDNEKLIVPAIIFDRTNEYCQQLKQVKVNKKRETLLNRLSRLEASLSKEKERTTKVMNNIGWGTGMRCTKCTPSFKRENELMEKIQTVKEQLKNIC